MPVVAGEDVGADAEAFADQQALALGAVELVGVVRDPIGEPRVVESNPSRRVDVEVEEVAAGK